MRIAAHTLGIDAAAALQPGRSGVVAAGFARSCYIRLGADWICVGDVDIGPGPLNVPCRSDAMPDWRTLAPARRGARVTGDTLILDERWGVVLAGAPVWQPPPCPAWTPTDARRGLGALVERLSSALPRDGLAQLLAPGGVAYGPVARAAKPAVAELEAWLARPRGRPSAAPRIAGPLLGLGPGLTPSGDDFLAGCLVALRATGRARRADELWSAIARAPGATNDISRAHLRTAARGRLGADLHGLLDAVLGGDAASLERAAARLERKPNHSPWDCLAGMCTVLRALTASRQAAVPGPGRAGRAAANRLAAG